MLEQWIKINSNSDYEVSNFGQVRTLKTKYHGRIIRPWINESGYHNINLWRNSKQEKWKLHRLVAVHFIPNPENLTDVDHIDFNKANNSASNLRWCSSIDNFKDGVINERHALKLSKFQIEEIRTLRNSGLKLKELAKMYNVSETTISRICLNQSWAWVGKTG